MKQVFDFQEPYDNLRSDTSQFRRENIKTTHYGIQSVKFPGPKIWVMTPQNIKVWKPEVCSCRMCKKYDANIGFIWLNIHLSQDLLCFISITFLFWLALIRHTYYLVWAIVFFKLTVNKVFSSIQFNAFLKISTTDSLVFFSYQLFQEQLFWQKHQ